ncbi:MAG: hypothetical protein BHW54_06735 [Subdoligranulum sp. 60_17]|nr:MAG: hypothetical protein BHW54_06735 [Subdoligranulum sp. 60_17]
MKKTFSRLPRVVRLAALSAVLLALCSKSSPLYAFNDWMDANIFFTMGRSMLGGRVLYRDVFDHKGPVLYLLYGLAGLVGGTDFRGVLVLEIVAMTSFLYTGLRTAELLLPFLAAALFSLIRALHSPTAKPLRAVCVQGLMAGCALWLKYTVLGFYLAWVVVLAALYLRRGWLTQLGRSVGAYLGGMVLATLPWVVYFGVHGALGDWFTAYFYDNLFLYKGEGGGLPALAQHLWWAVRDGLPAALLLAAFLLWALLTRRFAAAGGVAALAAGLAATSLMGGYLVYYGLVLAVFAPLGLVPLVRLAEKTPAPVRTALPWAVLAACAAACYALTPNRALRGRARADLPQYRFAAQINGGSLLNYGTLDGGFYTAAGVLPPCKYFCVTNMPLDDQWTDQQAVLKAGAVDYVVALTGDLHGDFPQYAVIDRCSYDGGEGEVTWYLYQLQR